MTVAEFNDAYKNGKIVVYDIKSEKGYVSRRLKENDHLKTGIAGGRRAGEKYLLFPRRNSTRYCYRVYYREAVRYDKEKIY